MLELEDLVTYDIEEVSNDFAVFCKASGIRESALTAALTGSIPEDMLDRKSVV